MKNTITFHILICFLFFTHVYTIANTQFTQNGFNVHITSLNNKLRDTCLTNVFRFLPSYGYDMTNYFIGDRGEIQVTGAYYTLQNTEVLFPEVVIAPFYTYKNNSPLFD